MYVDNCNQMDKVKRYEDIDSPEQRQEEIQILYTGHFQNKVNIYIKTDIVI